MPSSMRMEDFLNSLQVKVEAMAAIATGNTSTYPRNSEDWVTSITEHLPYVQMFEGSTSSSWRLSMACDRHHMVNIWVYAHTRKECRDIQEDILDIINKDERVKNGAGVPTAIYCRYRGAAGPYIYDKERGIFLSMWEYEVNLRSYI